MLIWNVDADFTEDFDQESKSELHSVDFDIQNTGDVTLDYDHIECEIEGYTRTDTPIISTLETGESDNIYCIFLDQITVDDGSHQLTIQFIKDGEETPSKTVTVNINN